MKKHKLRIASIFMLFMLMFAMPITVFAANPATSLGQGGGGDTTPATTTEDTSGGSDDASGASEAGITLGTGDAVNDILLDNRFAGAIESISFITKFVDHWFTVIITATAFFIISAAMLKNVMAGAYCSNHKFWDKVAEAHQSADAVSLASIGQYVSGKQFMNTTGGGVKGALLCLVPNIKAWTDFDDVDIEPKQYFMKAIPQMLACVIIGVFIYNGYYRNTAATVGDFGSEICNRVFSSVDAAKMVDKLTLTSATPDNIYKSDPTVEGQYRYTISMAAYKAVVSVFSDYTTTEQKTSLMRNCEQLAYKYTSNADFKKTFIESVATENKEYKLSNCKVRLTPSNDCPTSLVSGDIAWMDNNFTSDSSETRFSAGYIKMSDIGLNPTGVSAASNDTFYITASYKKVARTSKAEAIASKLKSDGSKVSTNNKVIPVTFTLDGLSSNTKSQQNPTDGQMAQVYNAIVEEASNRGYTLASNESAATVAATKHGMFFDFATSTKGDASNAKPSFTASATLNSDPTKTVKLTFQVTIIRGSTS